MSSSQSRSNKLDEVLKRLDSIQSQNENSFKNPSYPQDSLNDLSKRYNAEKHTVWNNNAEKLKENSTNPRSSYISSEEKANKKKVGNSTLHDLGLMRENLLKSANIKKTQGQNYLNNFFGLTGKIADSLQFIPHSLINSHPHTEDKTPQFDSFQEPKKSHCDESYKHYRDAKKNHLEFYIQEWEDTKEIGRYCTFRRPNHTSNLMLSNYIHPKEELSVFFKIQEQLQSRLRLYNNSGSSSALEILNIFEPQQLDAPLPHKSVFETVLDIAVYCESKKLTYRLRGTREYDISIVDFSISCLGQNFKNYIKMFNERMDTKNHVQNSIPSSITSPIIRDIKIYYHLNHGLNSDSYITEHAYGVPIWFLLYHLIRMHEYEASLEVAQALSPLYSPFIRILKLLSSNQPITLSSVELEEIKKLSNSRLNKNSDIFEKLLICLFTFHTVEPEFILAVGTIEEFLWFKIIRLKLSNLLNPTAIPDLLSILREEIVMDFEYFEKDSTPSCYSRAFCLLLVGSFESALEILSKDEIGISYSTIFAIILHRTNLIEASLYSKREMVIVKEKNTVFNIGALLNLLFIRIPFTNELFLIDYFIALHDVKSNKVGIIEFGAKILIKKLCQFERLLNFGWLSEEYKVRSPIYTLHYKNCIQDLASYCLECHENILSLALYLKIEDYSSAMKSMIDILIDVLCSPNFYSQNALADIITKGRFLADKYIESLSEETTNGETLLLLMDLSIYFSEFHSGHCNNAYKILNALNLLPSNTADIPIKINLLQRYPKKFKFILKAVLLSFSSLLAKIHQQSKYQDGKISPALATSLREQASSLLSFAAQLPYALPSYIKAKLIEDLSSIKK